MKIYHFILTFLVLNLSITSSWSYPSMVEIEIKAISQSNKKGKNKILLQNSIKNHVSQPTEFFNLIKYQIPESMELNATDGESNFLVAEIIEHTNRNYKILVSSENNGYLMNGDVRIPYTISYDSGFHLMPSYSPEEVKEHHNCEFGECYISSDLKISFMGIGEDFDGFLMDTIKIYIDRLY